MWGEEHAPHAGQRKATRFCASRKSGRGSMMQVHREDRPSGVAASFNIKHLYQLGPAIEATAVCGRCQVTHSHTYSTFTKLVIRPHFGIKATLKAHAQKFVNRTHFDNRYPVQCTLLQNPKTCHILESKFPGKHEMGPFEIECIGFGVKKE